MPLPQSQPLPTPTGGGAGIGAAICERFHTEGAKVYIVDVNERAADATAAALTDKQADAIGAEDGKAPRAVAAIVDISQEALVSAFMDQVHATDGRLDVLVNNAARFVLKRQVALLILSPLLLLLLFIIFITELFTLAPLPPFSPSFNSFSAEGATETDWDVVMGSNIKGYGLASKHAIRVMKATMAKGSASEACKYLFCFWSRRIIRKAYGKGASTFAYSPSLRLCLYSAGCSIVNLGSISSFVGQAGMCTYSATKAAILALTRCTAIDCGPYGIRVNAICPGPILTEATKKHADSQVREGGWERRAAFCLPASLLPLFNN